MKKEPLKRFSPRGRTQPRAKSSTSSPVTTDTTATSAHVRVQAEELVLALGHLNTLAQLQTAKRPPKSLKSGLDRLALWIANTLCPLEIVDVSSADWWDPISGWVQFLPQLGVRIQASISVKLKNNSLGPISGTVVAYLDKLAILGDGNPNLVDALAPGDEWTGNFILPGANPGLHKISIILISSNPVNSLVSFDPATGELSRSAQFATLSVTQCPFVVGDSDGVKSTITTMLGIAVTGAMNDARQGYGVDQDGITRRFSYLDPDAALSDQDWVAHEPEMRALFRYAEDQIPENRISIETSVYSGDVYDAPTRGFPFPVVNISVEGPVDAQIELSRLPYWKFGGDAPIQSAPPYETSPTGEPVIGSLTISASLNSTFDQLEISGKFSKWYRRDADHLLVSLSSENIPRTLFPVDATKPLPDTDLMRKFAYIFGRVGYFQSVFGDVPAVPAELQTWIANSRAVWGLQPQTETAPSSPPPIPPDQEKGLPAWYIIALGSTVSLLLRASCAAWQVPPWGTASCVVGTVLSVSIAHMTSRVDKLMQQYPDAKYQADTAQGSSGASSGGSSGSVEPDWPSPTDGGSLPDDTDYW